MTETSPTTDQPELLPCPFCGGKAVINDEPRHTKIQIICSKDCECVIGTDWREPSEAITAWNTRLTSTTPTLGDMECTDAMLRAGYEKWEGGSADECKAIWCAMNAAAPASPIPTSVANEGAIPRGMKAWPGGSAAPDDFDYDRVQFSDGSIGSVSKCSDLWSRTPVSGDPHVTAYTPAVANEGERERNLHAQRETIEACARIADRREAHGVARAIRLLAPNEALSPALDNTAAPEPWWTDAGSVAEARRAFQEGRRALLQQKSINTHLRGVYEPIIAALEPMLSTLAVLDTGKALALDNTAVEGWQSPDSAPKDGTVLELVVDYAEGHSPLQDATVACTIGWNDFENTGVDKWHIVGWDWCHDHIRDGAGAIRAWRPSRLMACDDGLPPLPQTVAEDVRNG